MKVAVIGAGFVGLVTAACLTRKGHQVRCVDLSSDKIAMIKRGKPPFFEPGLEELLRDGLGSGRLEPTDNPGAAALDVDVIFICVGTPDKSGGIDLSQVRQAAASVGEQLRRSDRYAVVVVKSTVQPGTTDGLVLAEIEEKSGKRVNVDFGLCMNPEFLREGNAVEDFSQPDRIVLGCLGDQTVQIMKRLYADYGCPVIVTTPRNAEMIKYASNSLLATLISFSNSFATLCERFSGTDVHEVLDVLALDKRISPIVDGSRVTPSIVSYLRAGSGYGGSCLPKDINSLRQFSRSLGVAPILLDAVSAINDDRPSSLLSMAEAITGSLRGHEVAVLGLTFKPGTDDLRESPSLKFLDALTANNTRAKVYDPAITPERVQLGDRHRIVASPQEALSDADAAFIITAWPEFGQFDWAQAVRVMRRPLVIDGREVLRGIQRPADLIYVPVGRSTRMEANAAIGRPAQEHGAVSVDPEKTMSGAAQAVPSETAAGATLVGAPAPRRKLISIVIPVYNEEKNVQRAYAEVCKVFDDMDRYDLEILFTDNHSNDRTPDILAEIASTDKRVRVVLFARNFGFQNSVLTGYRLATGDAAFQLDCDLQDPPALFPAFLEQWERGYDVVVGVRRTRKENKLIETMRKLFYRFLRRFSDDYMVVDGGDFRLVDRSVLDLLRTIHDAHPYTRGLISSLAARQVGIPYDRMSRELGQSKFPVRRLFGLAMDGILAHSMLPLRLATYCGLLMSLLLFLLGLFYIIARMFAGAEWPTGFATVAALVAMSASLNAIFLGIIGEYVGRIYDQVRRRPNTIIARTINLGTRPMSPRLQTPIESS
jgi:nucleotide sugar dehydrogenase